MFDRQVEMLKSNKKKLQKLIINKYFLGSGVVLILCLIMLPLLQSGQNKPFQAAHQELNKLAENIRGRYKVRPDYWGLDTASAIKNQLVPASMLRGEKIVSAIGREIILGQDAEGNMVMPGQRNFMITIPNLSKKACVSMMSHPFEQEEHLGLVKISLITPDEEKAFEWGGENPLPVTEKAAEQFCKNKNDISWVFE